MKKIFVLPLMEMVFLAGAMKKYSIIAAFLLLNACLFAQQPISLSFSGRYTDSSYVRLDSVRVENLFRSWTETLVYPDTVWTASSESVADAAENALQVRVYPNPSRGKGNLQVNRKISGPLKVQLLDMTGKTLAASVFDLEAGRHLFEISLPASRMYLLRLSDRKNTQTVKMVNFGNSGRTGIAWKGLTDAPVAAAFSTHAFAAGDTMRYTGYTTRNDSVLYSLPVQKIQQTGENITLYFEKTPDASEKKIEGTWVACGYGNENTSVPECFDTWLLEDGQRDTLVFQSNGFLWDNMKSNAYHQKKYELLNDSTLQLTDETTQHGIELRVRFLEDGHEIVIFCFRQYGLAAVMSNTRFRKIN